MNYDIGHKHKLAKPPLICTYKSSCSSIIKTSRVPHSWTNKFRHATQNHFKEKIVHISVNTTNHIKINKYINYVLQEVSLRSVAQVILQGW